MEKRMLITAFDPFGGSEVNPSQLAVEALPDEVAGFRLKKLVIPTVFGAGADLALAAAEEFAPDVVLCIGVAEGREAVTPERIAVNIRDARIPDNAGNQPKGAFVSAEGPAAYFATVPVEAMAEAIRKAGIPAAVSNSAGAFVCNDVMYTVLHHYDGTAVRAGFVHVPALPGGDKPSMELETIVAALLCAIGACA